MKNLNAMKHGLTNMRPVVLQPDEPEFEALRQQLIDSLKPNGFVQELTFIRILNSAWNMQRALRLENLLREHIRDDDPMGDPSFMHQADLYHRYFIRFEGSYRANMRELERLQRLQAEQEAFSGAEKPQQPIGVLYDVLAFQRAAKRTQKKSAAPPQTGPFAEPIAPNPVITPDFASNDAPQGDPKTPQAA